MVGPGTLQGRRLRMTTCAFVPEKTYLKLERLGTLGKGGLGEVSVIGRHLCCRRSVAKWCPALCDPMDCSMPGFPDLHYLLESAQTQVH